MDVQKLDAARGAAASGTGRRRRPAPGRSRRRSSAASDSGGVDVRGLVEVQAELGRRRRRRRRRRACVPRPRLRSGGVTTSAGPMSRLDAGGAAPSPRNPRCRDRRAAPGAELIPPPRGLGSSSPSLARLSSSSVSGVKLVPSRSARMAPLRWSRSVRSRIRTPSRWSISCWRTRASSPDASIRIGSPVDVGAGHPHVERSLDVHDHARQRQAAFGGRREARPTTTRSPGWRAPSASRPDPPGRPASAAARRAGSPRGPRPSRRA